MRYLSRLEEIRNNIRTRDDNYSLEAIDDIEYLLDLVAELKDKCNSVLDALRDRQDGQLE